MIKSVRHIMIMMVVVMVAFAPMAAAEQDQGKATSQIATAIQHAGLSANQEAVEGAMRHLHHAVNCIEGPNGSNFDVSAGYPCAAQEGNGILNDMGDADRGIAILVQAANDIAVNGVESLITTLYFAPWWVVSLVRWIKLETQRRQIVHF